MNNKGKSAKVLIPLIFLVLALFMLIIFELNIIKYSKDNSNTIKNTEIQNTIVNNTTDEEYKELINSSYKFISNQNIASSNVETVNGLMDNTFIDGEYKPNNNDSNYYMVYCIYLIDSTLNTFMDTNGNMISVISKLDRNTNTINSESINCISNLDILNEYSDEEYLNNIENILTDIIKNNKYDNSMKKYFTDEELSEILNNVKYNNISNTYINFITIGKSDTTLGYKDRIIVQMEVYSKGIKNYINIILKVDSDNKIFDIDII